VLRFGSAMVTPAPFEEIDVETLAAVLADPAEVQLIDVREPQEIEMAAIAAFENLPLSQFQTWGDSIHSRFDAERETIVMCHHGMRSAQMCQWLSGQGFTQLKNVSGGIDAYSIRVDPSIPRY
jgi:rhodanese-related sulfurtransferase